MNVAIINFSGNVGKTTVAKHLLLPRMKGADVFTVESINAEEESGEMVRGKQYGALQDQLLLADKGAIVDIGASNVEEFTHRMRQHEGSYEDYDIFIVPVVKDTKQVRDSIATIRSLNVMGVPPDKIRIVFNKLESDETVAEAFYPSIGYYQEEKNFVLNLDAAIDYNEVYHRIGGFGLRIDELYNDKTDYKVRIKESASQQEKEHAVAMIGMRRLSASAMRNLDTVYAALME